MVVFACEAHNSKIVMIRVGQMSTINHRLALGTVQFGIDYGVNNPKGKVPYDEVVAILDRCRETGIDFLDTSRKYGNSEEVLGSAIEELKAAKEFSVCTKLDLPSDYKTFGKSKLKDAIIRCVEESREALRVETIPHYLLHTYDYMLLENGYVWEVLQALKGDGVLGNLGISITWTTDEAFKALELDDLSLLQIPFNVFDTRWIETGLLDACASKKITVINRSTYLQGLFFMDVAQAIRRVPASEGYMQKLHQLAGDLKIPVQNLVFSYVLQEERIGYTLVGVDSLQQLEQNIALSQLPALEPEMIQKIRSAFSGTPVNLVNPSLWPSRQKMSD